MGSSRVKFQTLTSTCLRGWSHTPPVYIWIPTGRGNFVRQGDQPTCVLRSWWTGVEQGRPLLHLYALCNFGEAGLPPQGKQDDPALTAGLSGLRRTRTPNAFTSVRSKTHISTWMGVSWVLEVISHLPQEGAYPWAGREKTDLQKLLHQLNRIYFFWYLVNIEGTRHNNNVRRHSKIK